MIDLFLHIQKHNAILNNQDSREVDRRDAEEEGAICGVSYAMSIHPKIKIHMSIIVSFQYLVKGNTVYSLLSLLYPNIQTLRNVSTDEDS